jgi:hypothetical protein
LILARFLPIPFKGLVQNKGESTRVEKSKEKERMVEEETKVQGGKNGERVEGSFT